MQRSTKLKELRQLLKEPPETVIQLTSDEIKACEAVKFDIKAFALGLEPLTTVKVCSREQAAQIQIIAKKIKPVEDNKHKLLFIIRRPKGGMGANP
jgi:hypothetical protein